MQPLPRISVLKLDKDCYVPADWNGDWVRQVALPVCRSFGLDVISIHMSKTRKGFHLYMGISPSAPAELANRIQWVLGDDCRRVDFNRARIQVRYPKWDKLFEEENAVLRLIYRKVPAGTITPKQR